MSDLPWSFHDFEGKPVDVSHLLEAALRRNAALQVHVSLGYYD